jgi:hypothetical protein
MPPSKSLLKPKTQDSDKGLLFALIATTPSNNSAMNCEAEFFEAMRLQLERVCARAPNTAAPTDGLGGRNSSRTDN